MKCRWAAIVACSVSVFGCGMMAERYSADSFNRCNPSAKMSNVCYFKFNVKQVIPEFSRVVGTVSREVVVNNANRYGLPDFDPNTYPLDLEYTFQVKEADLAELGQKIGRDVCFKSIAGTFILEVERECPALSSLT
jgi:hypothetical protein